MPNEWIYAPSNPDQISGDKLLIAVSYECRFVESLKRDLQWCRLKEVILLVFVNYFDSRAEGSDWDDEAVALYQTNYVTAKDLVSSAGLAFREIRLTLDDLPEFIENVTELGSANFVLDFSTMPRSYLLLFLRHSPLAPTTLVYTLAKARKTDELAYTTGVKDVVILPGFEGIVGHKPTLLVLSIGFEGARAYNVFRLYEPTATLVFLGDPGTVAGDDRGSILAAVKANNSTLLATDTVHYEQLPSFDPAEFARIAQVYIDQMVMRLNKKHLSDIDVILAPVGTKVQALGLFNIWLRKRSYQIAYPIPSVRKVGTEEVGPTLIYRRMPL